MKNLHVSAAVLTGLLAVAGSALAADPVTVDIGQPVNAITVDGSLAEWQGVTPIKLDATMTADAKDVTDDKDLSAVAYAADYSGTLYLAVDVTDDKIVMERNADGNLWQSDAVEFWLGGQQFGITVDKDTHKVAALSWGGQDVSGWSVGYKTTDHGYNVEVAIPFSSVTAAIGADKIVADETSFPFAVGVDDLDTPGGSREGQEYFPLGWTWGQTGTFATATFR